VTERDLVIRATQGDERAFELLVQPHLDLAFRTACVVTRDASDAEDATQTALIKAHASLTRFRRDAPFRPWLLQIVANESRNAVRSRVRRRSDALPEDSESPDIEPGNDPVSVIESSERSAWLLEHINRLPESDRLLIHCRYVLELSEAEAATVLDCPRGTVKSRLHRALAKLRHQIEAESEETLP
jgi:RNA polymerase sigma-70 factor (ECF subfamily)